MRFACLWILKKEITGYLSKTEQLYFERIYLLICIFQILTHERVVSWLLYKVTCLSFHNNKDLTVLQQFFYRFTWFSVSEKLHHSLKQTKQVIQVWLKNNYSTISLFIWWYRGSHSSWNVGSLSPGTTTSSTSFSVITTKWRRLCPWQEQELWMKRQNRSQSKGWGRDKGRKTGKTGQI